ncbi:HBL/NHE enterotoxin family protein [Bacillus thuringiensis]|uniref:HBL/NHE enterotoxin family protein n=1 Tax=Bacillus thuringiensis TaxID=1428 RepID=A0AAW9GGE5_BACTU|nr:HBL/NHE enterotoxin family protein [Bacillus thuringiensis]MDY0854359.1 HBL/NHE enterotoxin family protein [Bacillus thuringiensis]MDY4393651.1 HBL/NHE enterotoxin family protein [Bacillus thuringiensis]
MLKKIPYKILVLSTTLAVVTPSILSPIQVFAQENRVTNTTPSLGPADIKKYLVENQKQVILLDTSALKLRQVSPFKFDYLNALGKDSKTEKQITELNKLLSNALSTAKDNAGVWLDQIKPQLIQTNENLISYNTRFKSFHSTLYDAAKMNDKDKLKKGLAFLSKDIQSNKDKVESLIKTLQGFRTNLTENAESFNQGKTDLETLLKAKDGINEGDQKLIDSYRATVDANNKIIIGSAVGLLVGIGMAIGGAIMIILPEPSSKAGAVVALAGAALAITGATGLGILVTNNNYLNAQIEQLVKKMAGNDILLSDLKQAKSKNDDLSTTMEKFITDLQNVGDQWSVVDSKIRNTIDMLNQTDTEDLSFIIPELDSSLKQWEDVDKTVRGFYK